MKSFFQPFESVPEAHSATQEDGDDNDMQHIDEIGLQELANNGWPAAEANVLAIGDVRGQCEGVDGLQVAEEECRFSDG